MTDATMTAHPGRPRSLASGARCFDVECVVILENTAESLHAHVELVGYEPEAGDAVLVHGAPDRLNFGEKRTLHLRATVTRGGPLQKLTARIGGYLGLLELYEVSFSDGRL